MATLTVYSTTSDGYWENNSNIDYATVHDAANAASKSSIANTMYIGQRYVQTGTVWQVYRAGLFFVTSALPDDCTITAATLSLFGYHDHSDTDFNLTVVAGTDIADPIEDADYGDLLNDVTSFGSVTTLGFSIVDYNAISLNADGLTAISKTGTTKFGLRSSRDISNTTPKLNGATNNEYVEVYSTDKGIGYEPRLVITYTTAFTPKIFFF